ncbi:FAD-binding oxidoreductase [Escherichia coli]|uniref:FAD-binding oxidoreductase n=1 Tax=Escherichia coli TaxID=562 RepID=UPI0037DC60F6
MEHAIDYSPGQFAFLTFAHSKESHPFTIASYTKEKNTLRFAIKNLGDYTSTLASSIKIGQSAFVEGPWGKFDLDSPLLPPGLDSRRHRHYPLYRPA